MIAFFDPPLSTKSVALVGKTGSSRACCDAQRLSQSHETIDCGRGRTHIAEDRLHVPEDVHALASLFAEPIETQEFRKRGVRESFLASLPAELDGSLRFAAISKSPTKGVRSTSSHRLSLAEAFYARLLNADEELALFRRLNFAKYLGRKQMRNRNEFSAGEVEELQQLARIVLITRDTLVECNLRLVVSIAKRFVDDANSLTDLVSDGNWTLLRAVEKFDYSQGNRFSTYATHAIQRAFFRSVMKRRNGRLSAASISGEEDTLEMVSENADGGAERESYLAAGYQEIQRILPLLDERERVVIEERFALNGQPKALTFQKIGAKLGVCKERVRQIQLRAFEKLRRFIQPRFADIFALES